MYKKAGVVVGALVIILAFGIYAFANALQNKKDNPEKQTQPQSTQTQTQPTQPQTQQTQTQQTQTQTQPTQSQTKPIQPQKAFSDITEQNLAKLGNPIAQLEEIMVVAKKKLVLLDGKTGTTEAKQLTYAVDLMTSDQSTLTLFLNKSAYDTLTVGSKLKISYSKYRNDVGAIFPVIENVTAVN